MIKDLSIFPILNAVTIEKYIHISVIQLIT